MFALLECLKVPLLKYAVKFAGNVLGGGIIPLGDFLCEVVWEGLSKRRSERQMGVNIQEIVQQQKEYRRQTYLLRDEIAANQPEPVRNAIITILSMIPGTIQRSLQRSEDPSGLTVPSNLRLRCAADLRKFLPDQMPQFNVGDRPLRGSDLVLKKFIGMGGFGEVWKAVHEDNPNAPAVALKFCKDAAASKSLQREAELLDRVAKEGRHPNIVKLIDTHVFNQFVCLEYEYIDGGDLAGLAADLHHTNRATPERIAMFVLQLANAVGFAHSLQPPIVHRDLKPANVLVQRTGGKIRLKIADFGIGGLAVDRVLKESRETARSSGKTTMTSAYTPLYASSQQRRGKSRDPRDDVYALGVIWYQLLTGDLMTEAPRGVGWKQRLADREMLPEMIELLEQCVEDDEQDRPENAFVLAERLRDCLRSSEASDDQPLPAQRTTTVSDKLTTKAESEVIVPGYALMVSGLVGMLFNLGTAVVSLVKPPNSINKADVAANITGVVFFGVFAAASLVVILAGINMVRLRNYQFVLVGALLATIGMCFCSVVGLPVGLWCVIVIHKHYIRIAFR